MVPSRAHEMHLCPQFVYRARRLCVVHKFIAVASAEVWLRRERGRVAIIGTASEKKKESGSPWRGSILQTRLMVCFPFALLLASRHAHTRLDASATASLVMSEGIVHQ
eukprot:scaffold42521_cov204-Skeletonema_marinoi.AAC.2